MAVTEAFLTRQGVAGIVGTMKVVHMVRLSWWECEWMGSE